MIALDRWDRTFSNQAIVIVYDSRIAGKCFHMIAVDRARLLAINSDYERLYGDGPLVMAAAIHFRLHFQNMGCSTHSSSVISGLHKSKSNSHIKIHFES